MPISITQKTTICSVGNRLTNKVLFPYKDWLNVASGDISQPVKEVPQIQYRDRSPIRINIVKIPTKRPRKIKGKVVPTIGVIR